MLPQTSSSRVREAVGSRDVSAFVELPWRIYRGHEAWVPPLRFDVKRRLDRKKNPFFLHSEAACFLAERDGEVVGRIAAIHNRRHGELHRDDRVGFFGFFECIDDAGIARALIDQARSWLAERGLHRIRGPVSFSLNDEAGLLIDAFDEPPAILTPYNPPYYARLLESCGLEKVMDLHSFDIPVAEFGASRIGRIVDKVKRRESLSVRNFRKRDFPAEIERFKRIYNDAWEDNWGFVPLTDAEIDHMAADLKPILVPRMACFVEVDDRPVGFSLVLPDINQILRRLDGRLFPFGLPRLLLGLRRLRRGRLLAMGVVRDYHHRGLDAVLYENNFHNARALGWISSEIGWVLETNTVMLNTLERIGAHRSKTHRLYEG